MSFGTFKTLIRDICGGCGIWTVWTFGVVAFCGVFVGCFGGKGGDSDAIDASFSSPAVEQTVSGALADLQRLSTLSENKEPTICFLGVSGKAPGAPASAFSAATRRQFESRSSFRTLEKSAVESALKESDVRANNLFIPAERKKFVAALGEPVDFLLTGSLEPGKKADSDDSDGESDSNAATGSIYKLELVDLATNKKYEYVAKLN